MFFKKMGRFIKLIVLFLLFSKFTVSQSFSFKKEFPSIATMYLAGVSDGTAETLKFHYSDFKRVFPSSNPNYWDMKISWKNKYKNQDYNQGPKFFGSTTFLVWTTDGYHMSRFAKNTMFVTTILIHPKEKKKFKNYLLDVFIHSTSYHLGFFSTYETLFKNR